MGGPCFKLRFRERELWLVPGTYLIGRGALCHLRIDEPTVSRHHAELVVVSPTHATIRDRGSGNGTFVNGERLGGAPAHLAPGSQVVIGKEVISIQAASQPPPSRDALDTLTGEEDITVPPLADTDDATVQAPLADLVAEPWTVVPPRPEGGEGADRVSHTVEARRSDALGMFGPVARSALSMGRAEDAEAILGAHLRAVLSRARAREDLPRETVSRTMELAVELAAAGRAGWFDFVVDLCEATRTVPPLALVTTLEASLRRQPSVDTHRLSHWVQSLRGRLQTLQLDDLASIDRLETMLGAAIRLRQ